MISGRDGEPQAPAAKAVQPPLALATVIESRSARVGARHRTARQLTPSQCRIVGPPTAQTLRADTAATALSAARLLAGRATRDQRTPSQCSVSARSRNPPLLPTAQASVRAAAPTAESSPAAPPGR